VPSYAILGLLFIYATDDVLFKANQKQFLYNSKSNTNKQLVRAQTSLRCGMLRTTKNEKTGHENATIQVFKSKTKRKVTRTQRFKYSSVHM